MALDTFYMTKYKMTSKSAILGQIKNLTHVDQDLIMSDNHMQNKWNPAAVNKAMALDTYHMLKYRQKVPEYHSCTTYAQEHMMCIIKHLLRVYIPTHTEIYAGCSQKWQWTPYLWQSTSKSAILDQIRNLTYVHQDLILGDNHMQNEWNPSRHLRVMAADKNC